MGNMCGGSGTTGPLKYKRKLPPAHFSLSIRSFSLLLESSVEKYESGVFEAGGYRWSLSLYPNGDKKNGGEGYISLYLAIETDSLRHGWVVDVNYKLFVYNKTRDKYLTIQDADGVVRRFHEKETRGGFPRLISLKKFKEPSNGYLVEDMCQFGVEILVINSTGMRQENLTMFKLDPPNNTYSWKIPSFSKLSEDFYHSRPFPIGGNNWKIKVFPNGCSEQQGESLSVFLELVSTTGLPSRRKFYAKYNLRVLDRLSSNHMEKRGEHWFSASKPISGFEGFLPLEDLRRFVDQDTLVVEAQILVSSTDGVS